MITLIELINATTWQKPQDHIRISIWDKSKIYDKGEFEDIELNVRTLAKYANYMVSDIDVDFDFGDNTNEPMLVCMISKE